LKRVPTAAVLARLRTVRGFLFDLDGTLVLGDKHNLGFRALPGALEFTRRLTALRVPFAVLTNGTVRTPAQYAEKLRAMGFAIEDHMMLTPASIAAEYFRRRGIQRVLVLGGEGVTGPLAAAGLEPVLPREHRSDVQAIMLGWYREFKFEDLELACEAAWGGARVFTASLSPFYATADGRALGTSRAIAAMIASLTGKRATILGKPALFALKFAATQIGVKSSALAVVGDDPELEVPMAHRGRSLAVAVHSGVGRAAAFESMSRATRAHLVVRDIAELARLYVTGAASGAAAKRALRPARSRR